MSIDQHNHFRRQLASNRMSRPTDDESLMVNEKDQPIGKPDDHDEDDKVLHSERWDGMG